MSRFIALLVLILSTGCGYKIVAGNADPMVFTIDRIPGDSDGTFLQTLIKTSELYPGVEYQAFSAPRQLKMRIIGLSTDYIGFQYQTDDDTGEIINRLSPTEGQHAIKVQLSLIDTTSQKVVLGPKTFEVAVDYAFVDSKSYRDLTFVTPTGTTETVLSYSLGQLDSEEAATLGSKDRLYRKISEEVMSFLLAAH